MKLFLNLNFYLAIFVLFLFPFLPQGLVVFNLKLLALSFLVFLFLSQFLLNLIITKKITFAAAPFNRPLFILLTAFLFSTVFSDNRVFSFLSPTGGLTILVLVFWYYFLSGLMVSQKEKILKILIFSATIFSLFSLMVTILPFVTKLFSSVFPLLNFPLQYLTSNFSSLDNASDRLPTSTYEQLVFLIPPTLISGFYLFNSLKQKARFSKSVFLLTFSFLLLSGTVINLLPLSLHYNYSYSQVVILPHQFAYQVAIDTLKNPKEAILGFGPGNYNIAFNLNRPAGLNIVENGKFAGLRFGSSSNFPFQLITETGILGILAWVILVLVAFRQTKKYLFSRATGDSENGNRSDGWRATGSPTRGPLVGNAWGWRETGPVAVTAFWATIFLSLLFPPNLTLWFYLFTFLALISPLSPKTIALPGFDKYLWLAAAGLSIPFFASIYFLGRAVLADFYFQKSLQATAKNDKIISVFNLQNQAINLNPYLPVYHQVLSQTLLFWANAIPSQNKEGQLSDQDRQTISALLQQTISQAQTAISLSPKNAFYWENLGLIYRGLIPVVNAADTWAVSSFSQAVLLDPNNPNTRFSLAGVFLQMQNFNNARQQLEITTALSPNFANGFYNLSFAQKNLKLYPQALQSLNQAIILLPADSPDLPRAQNEKQELEKLAKEATTSPAIPSSPSSSLSPKLNLPQTASPSAHFKP